MNELLHMGEHGIFVGAAYCITLFVFGINTLIAVLEKRRVKKILLQHLTRNNNP
jgi:heme exporter protein CcmD